MINSFKTAKTAAVALATVTAASALSVDVKTANVAPQALEQTGSVASLGNGFTFNGKTYSVTFTSAAQAQRAIDPGIPTNPVIPSGRVDPGQPAPRCCDTTPNRPHQPNRPQPHANNRPAFGLGLGFTNVVTPPGVILPNGMCQVGRGTSTWGGANFGPIGANIGHAQTVVEIDLNCMRIYAGGREPAQYNGRTIVKRNGRAFVVQP